MSVTKVVIPILDIPFLIRKNSDSRFYIRFCCGIAMASNNNHSSKFLTLFIFCSSGEDATLFFSCGNETFFFNIAIFFSSGSILLFLYNDPIPNTWTCTADKIHAQFYFHWRYPSVSLTTRISRSRQSWRLAS